jgi:hypothetical protein
MARWLGGGRSIGWIRNSKEWRVNYAYNWDASDAKTDAHTYSREQVDVVDLRLVIHTSDKSVNTTHGSIQWINYPGRLIANEIFIIRSALPIRLLPNKSMIGEIPLQPLTDDPLCIFVGLRDEINRIDLL